MERYIILEDMKTGERINSLESWGLILGNKEISIPQPKTTYVNVEGADGTLDLTEAVTGETKYNDRTLKYPFTLLDKFMDLPNKISEIANFIHGKKFKIFNYDDMDFYYVGRVSINEFKTSQATGLITLEAVCEPYKYKKDITTYQSEINGSKTIFITNLRRRAVPIITTDSEMKITFNGTTYTINSGTHEILNICFEQGSHELFIEGNGTIEIKYQECSL